MNEIYKMAAMEVGKSLNVGGAGFEIPRYAIPSFVPPPPMSAAARTFKTLGKCVKEFESGLDQDHEIGAKLVSFGNTLVFHIVDIGYHGPDIVTFHGVNESGERIQLIQNASQLSVLLVAMKRMSDVPRRIGFIWDDETIGQPPSAAQSASV